MDREIKEIYTFAYGGTGPETIPVSHFIYAVSMDNPTPILRDMYDRWRYQIATREFFKDQWCVYMLETADASYYTGIAKNLPDRLGAHREGRGSKYVRSRLPFSVVYIELVDDRSTASKLEYHIKRLTKRQKNLIRMAHKEHTSILTCGCDMVLRMRDHERPASYLRCPSCGSVISNEEHDYDLGFHTEKK